jgi:hypothetical protein
MRRLQIMLEDETYEALNIEAARVRVSKASLVRRYLRSGLEPLPPLAEDPLSALLGSAEFEPAPVDDVLYSR